MARFSKRRFVYCLACLGTFSLLLSGYAVLYKTGPAREGQEAGHPFSLLVEREVGGTPSRLHHQLRDKIGRLPNSRPITASKWNNLTVFSRANTTTASSQASSTPDNLQALKEKFPHFMIIGFGKSGTRALYDALRLHPQLAGPQKEERFFSLKYRKGLTKYLSSFPPRPQGGYLIEKSPDYILQPKVPARITAAAELAGRKPEDLKFIVITRNPIDRAMSEYLEWNIQRRRSNFPKLPPFDEMVLKDGVLHTEQPFINASCYEYHIASWLKTFSQSQMCYMNGDAFVERPFQQVQLLESCMGLEPFFSEENFVLDKKKGFYCFKSGSDTQCMGGAKGRPHPQISDDVSTHLVEYFHRCNSHLAQHTGFEIGN
jgi:[heparan sulfate]-glucosamine 3-sulfotransferase 4